MALRKALKKSLEGIEEDVFLVFFEGEKLPALATRHQIQNEGELKPGDQVQVKHGNHIYEAKIVSKGTRKEMEAILAIQGAFTEARSKKQKDGRKTRAPTPRDDESDDDDQPPAKKPKKKLVFSDEEDDVGDVQKEMDKVRALTNRIERNAIPDLHVASPPRPGPSHGQEQRILALEQTVAELQRELRQLRDQPRMPVAPSPRVTASESPAGAPCGGRAAEEPQAVMHNGTNLLNVATPPKDPVKCALRLLGLLFTREELRDSLVYESSKSKKRALDPERINKLFLVLRLKYGKEKVDKVLQAIVEACNQKCRDARRQKKE